MSKKQQFLLMLVLTLALVIRIWYVAAIPQGPLENDAYGYHMTAINLLENSTLGYYSTEPNAFITPGYPLFMAGVYYIFGSEEYGIDMIRYIQAIMSVVVVYLIFLLAYKLAGYKEALIASLVATFYPPFIWANTTILTEVLFTFLLTTFVFILNKALVEEKTIWFLLSGSILGIASLVRPTPSMFIPIAIFLIFINFKKINRKGIYFSLALVISFLIVMSPWWIRNYNLYDRFVAFSTLGGNPFLWGVHPWHEGIEETFESLPPEPDEFKLNEMWYVKAEEIIKENLDKNPIGYAYWFTLGKFSYLWRLPHLGYSSFSTVTMIGTKIIHLLIVISAWVYILRDLVFKKSLDLTIMAIYLTSLHMVYHVIPRYSFPLMPLMIIFSVLFTAEIFKKFKKQKEENKILDT